MIETKIENIDAQAYCVLCKCGGRKPNEQRSAIGLWLGQKFFPQDALHNLAFVLFIFIHIFI
jgi:uncharacterized protein